MRLCREIGADWRLQSMMSIGKRSPKAPNETTWQALGRDGRTLALLELSR